jgi:hypothetical protein
MPMSVTYLSKHTLPHYYTSQFLNVLLGKNNCLFLGYVLNSYGAWGSVVVKALPGSQDRFPVVSMGIFSVVPSDKTMCPEVYSASENEYQVFLLE